MAHSRARAAAAFVFLSWLLASPALAKSSAGPLMGIALPSQGSTTLMLGLKADTALTPKLTVGAFFMKFGSSVETTTSTDTISASSTTTLFGIEGLYPFSPTISAGLKLGLAKNATSVTSSGTTALAIESDASSLFLGPTLTYDAPISPLFSLGGELIWAFAFSSDVPKALMLAATVKVNF